MSSGNQALTRCAYCQPDNCCPDKFAELMEYFICSINNIRESPIKLRGRIVQSELPFFCTNVLHY